MRTRVRVRAGDKVKIEAEGYVPNGEERQLCCEKIWIHVVAVASGLIVGYPQATCHWLPIHHDQPIEFLANGVIAVTRGENWA